jgi:hypothetical protein
VEGEHETQNESQEEGGYGNREPRRFALPASSGTPMPVTLNSPSPQTNELPRGHSR